MLYTGLETVYMVTSMSLTIHKSYYLCQVNGVNGGDTVFVLCVSVHVCAQRTGPVNNSSKTVKTTDFKFDAHISRDSPDFFSSSSSSGILLFTTAGQ